MNVLQEALSAVNGRGALTYGDAYETATRFASVAKAITGLEIEPYHFPLLMIAVKISRIGNNRRHKDNFVDLAGYTLVAERIFNKEYELDNAQARKTMDEWEEKLT